MLRAVLFDVGGVLAYRDTDAADELLRAIDPNLTSEAVAAALVRPTTYPLWKKYSCGEVRGDSYWRAVLRDMGHEGSERQVRQMREAQSATWWARIDPEAIALVERLRAQPALRLGVLSNSCPEHEPFIASVEPLFEIVRFSHRTGLRKPWPEAYLAAAEELGVAPESVLFIDDRERNLAPASELGMRTILYAGAGELALELGALGLLDGHPPAATEPEARRAGGSRSTDRGSVR